MRTSRVLIVGAGPTGLTLACDLRSRGIEVLVLERLHEPAPAFRALGLQPRGRQILERLGALADLRARALTSHSYGIFVNSKRAALLDLDKLAGPNDEGTLRLPQTEIERNLRERFDDLGGVLQWGTEVTAATEDKIGLNVVVRRNGGEEFIRADWLIGCDGAHSTVRNLIGAQLEGSTFPEPFMVADVRLSGEPRNGAGLYLHRNYAVAVAPLPGGQWRFGGSLPKDDPLARAARENLTADTSSRTVPSGPQLAMLQNLYASLSGDTRTLFTSCSWFAVFSIHRRTASAFCRGRLFLAGDAAHLSSPLGGQGMNSGIADAFNLGWKLALVCQGRADARLLGTYESERRPATEKIERATTQWTRILLGEGLLNQFLRRFMLLPALRLPFVLGWVMTRRPALRSHYRGGPLAGHGSLFSKAPLPGDEAPDVPCVRSDGTTTRVGREVGAFWGLLYFGEDDDGCRDCEAAAREHLGADLRIRHILSSYAPSSSKSDVDDRVLIDSKNALGRAFHARRGSTILLRPDGYVAWRAPQPDAPGLGNWLKGIAGIALQTAIDIGNDQEH